MSSSLDKQEQKQEHNAALEKQRHLSVKRGSESKQITRHGITSSNWADRRLFKRLFPVLLFDTSDSAGASYCNASLLSYLSSLHPTSEQLDFQSNDLASSPNLIGTIKQDFYTLQDRWIGQPLRSVWFRPWIPRPDQFARHTRRLIRHYISSLNIVEDFANIPGFPIYSRLDFQTRKHKPLLSTSAVKMFNLMDSLSSEEAHVSLTDRLCATNNNGLPSSNMDPTTQITIKPRCQRLRSAVGTALPHPITPRTHTTQRTSLTPRITINESRSMTEDLYDVDDDASGSVNSDETLKSDPIAYTGFQVRSLKPPASPRRSLVSSHKPTHHNRSRSSSRNGLRFERIAESGTPTSADDSGNTLSLNTPKPRKRHQSITDLDYSTSVSRGDESVPNKERQTSGSFGSESLNPFLHHSSAISDKQNDESVVPRPAQRSRSSALQLASKAPLATRKDSLMVHGFRVHQKISPLARVAMTHKVVAHTPLRCVWIALELCLTTEHWVEPWSQITKFVESSRIACSVRYSSSSVFRLGIFQPSNVVFYMAMPIESHDFMPSTLYLLKVPETVDPSWVAPRGSQIWNAAETKDRNAENGSCDSGDTVELRRMSHPPLHVCGETGDTADLLVDSVSHLNMGKSSRSSEIDGLANQTQSKAGTIGLDLIRQLREARSHLQRKLDELKPQEALDEPELLAASCEQLRTFLGQLEAYNFRVGAARTRNAPGPRQMGDTGLVPDELESLWNVVVRLTEKWFAALQKAFIQSKGLQQVLSEFQRDLTFVGTRLQSFLQSSARKPLSVCLPGRSWRDMAEELPSTEEDEEDAAAARATSTRRSDANQPVNDLGHVPTALRLLRVIRFRLSGWFSHINLLLLTTESTHVLSSITRIQAGRPVRSRFMVDELTSRGLKQIRTTIGRLVDEAEQLLSAWSTRTLPRRSLLAASTSSCNGPVNSESNSTLFDTECLLSGGTGLNSPGSGLLGTARRRRFKDHDSLFSSDTDDNIEELVSVTSRSSVSLVSDGSDELVNCDQGIDTSWASEVTAQSLAPSDNTSCGLTATLSTRSFRSTTILAQQQQQEQQQQQISQPPTELRQIDGQVTLQSGRTPVDPDYDGTSISLNTPCNTSLTSNTPTSGEPPLPWVDLDSWPFIEQNPASVKVSPSIATVHNPQPYRPIWSVLSWLPETFQFSVVGNLFERWSRVVVATFTLNEEARIQLSSQDVQDSQSTLSKPLPERTLNPEKRISLVDKTTRCSFTQSHPAGQQSPGWALRRWSWPCLSRRSRFCDFLIGVLVTLLFLLSFPFFIHVLFSLPYFHSTVDVDPRSICVYRWFRLPWSQDTQEVGPGRTLTKTWPHNAPPF